MAVANAYVVAVRMGNGREIPVRTHAYTASDACYQALITLSQEHELDNAKIAAVGPPPEACLVEDVSSVLSRMKEAVGNLAKGK